MEGAIETKNQKLEEILSHIGLEGHAKDIYRQAFTMGFANGVDFGLGRAMEIVTA